MASYVGTPANNGISWDHQNTSHTAVVPIGLTLTGDEYPLSVTIQGIVGNAGSYDSTATLYLCDTSGNNSCKLLDTGSIPKCYQDPRIPWHLSGGNNGETVQVPNMVYGEKEINTTINGNDGRFLSLKRAALAIKKVSSIGPVYLADGFKITIVTAIDKKTVTLTTNNASFGNLYVNAAPFTQKTAQVQAGASFTIRSIPETGYTLKSITTTAGTIKETIISGEGTQDKTYTFTMPSPATDATVTGTYERIIYSVNKNTNLKNKSVCTVSGATEGTVSDSITVGTETSNSNKYRFLYWNYQNSCIEYSSADPDNSRPAAGEQGKYYIDTATWVDRTITSEGTVPRFHVYSWNGSKYVEDIGTKAGTIISKSYSFNMPAQDVDVTAHWLEHEIIWTNPGITISQNSGMLTITMGGTARDNFSNNTSVISYYLKKGDKELGQIVNNGELLDGTNPVGTTAVANGVYQCTYRLSAAEENQELEFSIVAKSSLAGVEPKIGGSTRFTIADYHSYIQYWDGEKYVTCIPYYIVDGSDQSKDEEVMVYYHDGTNFVFCNCDPAIEVAQLIEEAQDEYLTQNNYVNYKAVILELIDQYGQWPECMNGTVTIDEKEIEMLSAQLSFVQAELDYIALQNKLIEWRTTYEKNHSGHRSRLTRELSRHTSGDRSYNLVQYEIDYLDLIEAIEQIEASSDTSLAKRSSFIDLKSNSRYYGQNAPDGTTLLNNTISAKETKITGEVQEAVDAAISSTTMGNDDKLTTLDSLKSTYSSAPQPLTVWIEKIDTGILDIVKKKVAQIKSGSGTNQDKINELNALKTRYSSISGCVDYIQNAINQLQNEQT